MGASFAKMEAPLGAGGPADDGSSLLPPAARAGMTVRIKKKRERVRELDFFDHLISARLKSSSTLSLCFYVSRFLRRFSVPLLFALSSEGSV